MYDEVHDSKLADIESFGAKTDNKHQFQQEH